MKKDEKEGFPKETGDIWKTFFRRDGSVRAYHVPRDELLHVFLRINLYYDGNLLNLR